MSYNDTQIVEPDLETLIIRFSKNEYDAIFVVLHPKKLNSLDMSKNVS